MKILSGVHMVHRTIHLCAHLKISVIHLVVISQVICHHVAGHQGLPSTCPKLTNFRRMQTVLGVLWASW